MMLDSLRRDRFQKARAIAFQEPLPFLERSRRSCRTSRGLARKAYGISRHYSSTCSMRNQTMLKNWKPHHSAMVADHLARLLGHGPGPRCFDIRIAQVTHCLPVYEYMSGSILLSTSGEFLFYDDESGSVDRLDDSRWENIALVSLTRRYPDMSDLLPPRPRNAIACPACSGAGRVPRLNVICGECAGLGWKDDAREKLRGT